jgi:hypothetical protein
MAKIIKFIEDKSHLELRDASRFQFMLLDLVELCQGKTEEAVNPKAPIEPRLSL